MRMPQEMPFELPIEEVGPRSKATFCVLSEIAVRTQGYPCFLQA